MRKTYITPAQQELELHVEQMLAASGDSYKFSNTETTSQFSDKKGWSNEMWSSMDEN